jgi:hypothetical protein
MMERRNKVSSELRRGLKVLFDLLKRKEER